MIHKGWEAWREKNRKPRASGDDPQGLAQAQVARG